MNTVAARIFSSSALAGAISTGGAPTPLLLDPSIRDWVLFPIILITLLVGLLRHYVTSALKGKPAPKMNTIRNAQTAAYARQLLEHGYHLSQEGYKERVHRLCGAGGQGGALRRKVEGMQMDQMMDPSMMTDMMKNNFVFMVPNFAMMTMVSYFFSGFVVAKVPFALSSRFRGMMQRGVDIDHLDVSYVTSLSMYFMIMFGLQGLIALIVGGEMEGGESQMMQKQMMMGQPNQPVDYSKVFPSLREELEFSVDHYKYHLTAAPDAIVDAAPRELTDGAQ